MLRTLLLSSSLLIALCACQQESANAAAPSPSATTTPVIQPPHAAAATCPAPTFDAFFKRFADDVAVQKAYVADPLQSDSVDAEAEPEPAPVHKSLKKSDVEFPLLPSTAQQASDGLKVATTQQDAADIVVQITKPDTDYQKTFHFRPADGCWTLYRTEDESL